MFSLDGRSIGDAWYYEASDAVHVYFLTKPEGSDAGLDIGHAVSRDLVDWEYLGPALERGALGAWDDRNLATGSVIRHGGRYWMAFTGHKMGEPLFVQRAGMAVSDDLVRWEKLPENPTSEADPAHYELVSTGQRTLTHWRDPFLLDTGEDVVMYVTARRTHGDITTRGAIGLARSTDMRRWEALPALEHDPIAEEMEVPQVYAIDGRYYLVFCTKDYWLSPSYTSRVPRAPASQHGLRDGRRLPAGAVPPPRDGGDHANGPAHALVREPAGAPRGRLVPAEHRHGRLGPHLHIGPGACDGRRDRTPRPHRAMIPKATWADVRVLRLLLYPAQSNP